MRKTLCLVFLGCALVVGLACSGDATTPTAPATTSTMTAVTGASADTQYICHGDRSNVPYGVVVEVSDETYKRHYKHLANTRDCLCQYDSIAGQECQVTNGDGHYCDNNYDCPSNE